MIGKPEWFGPRKYTGWGITPRTWQGWAYIASVAALASLAQFIPVSETIRNYIMLLIAAVFAADFVLIILKVKRDERENIHEAFADRNALWAVLTVLIVGIAYETATSVVTDRLTINPWIIVALAAGLIAKIITNIYLDKRD